MHPGNDARTVLIVICLVKGLPDELVGDQGRLPDQLERQLSAFVQLLHDFFGVGSDMSKALISVQIL